MKKFRIITGIFLLSALAFTSCQSEVDSVSGDNPNTNTANSETANSITRISSYDGSSDDFLDDNSATTVLFPVKVTVNGIKLNLLSELDYQQVKEILAKFVGDDTIVFEFPIRLKTRDYSEIIVNGPEQLNQIVAECRHREELQENPIFCLRFNFPITLLTYNLKLEQTGSIVINSKRDLYNYMKSLPINEIFSIKYPISITHHNGTVVTINSNLELRANIKECLERLAERRLAESKARELEKKLIIGMFKVQSLVVAGVDKADLYKEFTLNFTYESKVKAFNLTLGTINGVFDVKSELNVILHIEFEGDTAFKLLNKNWKFTSFGAGTISFQSSTDPAVTMVLKLK